MNFIYTSIYMYTFWANIFLWCWVSPLAAFFLPSPPLVLFGISSIGAIGICSVSIRSLFHLRNAFFCFFVFETNTAHSIRFPHIAILDFLNHLKSSALSSQLKISKWDRYRMDGGESIPDILDYIVCLRNLVTIDAATHAPVERVQNMIAEDK